MPHVETSSTIRAYVTSDVSRYGPCLVGRNELQILALPGIRPSDLHVYPLGRIRFNTTVYRVTWQTRPVTSRTNYQTVDYGSISRLTRLLTGQTKLCLLSEIQLDRKLTDKERRPTIRATEVSVFTFRPCLAAALRTDDCFRSVHSGSLRNRR